MLMTGLLSACTQAMLKAVGQRLPITEFVALRQAMMLVLLVPLILRNPIALRANRPRAHALRVALALGGMMFSFTAVVHLPLADATAIDFAKSFFITILAIIFLREQVGARRWAATIVGFVGVLIMVRPGTEGFSIYALSALAGAACWAGMPIINRLLSQVELPLTIMIYQVFFIGVAITPFAVYWWVPPGPVDWLLIFGAALFSVAIQFGAIFAVRAGEPSAIAPFDYAKLFYAAILGVLIFGDWPTIYTVAGAVLILGASIYTMRREHRIGRETVARAETEPRP